MYLLILITLMSILSVYSSNLSNPLITWLKKPSKQEREITLRIIMLRQEQSQISMIDNFAAHAKMQRKINSLEVELKDIANDRTSNNVAFNLGVTYGVKFVLAVCILFVIIYYRYTPVYILPEYMNLFPLNKIISYPNTEIGAISVHFWVMISNSVARQFLK